MARDITFGQYFAADSIVHRMDPRAKFVLLIYLIVIIFVAGNVPALVGAVVLTLLLMFLSGIPVKMYFKSIKVIIPIVIFTAILNVFYSA